MLLSTQSSFFCPSERFSFEKNSHKSKVSLFGNYEKSNLRSKNIGMVAVNVNGFTYLRSPHHPLESELQSEMESSKHSSGIGIDEFFEGKNIFITGATGLVGKAIVEKLLTSTSVGKIYLLVKANDNETALDRLSKEIINSTLFECIREKHGGSYEEFVREKLVPVVGDICKPNLGMDTYSAHAIMEEVDVMIGSAANTAFNDRYDFLLEANVNAPQRLMRFAKRCKNLKLFVHISTAYINGSREEIILEKPLVMGDQKWRKESEDDKMSSSSFNRLNVTDEINLVMKSSMAKTDYDSTKELKRLGRERYLKYYYSIYWAAFHGLDNTYQLSKALGEMILNEIKGDVPMLVIRPTIIESSYKDPVPGWIQGNRMLDPVIISYGKGHLPAVLNDPNVYLDVVPLDMVANTTIAAIAKHGNVDKPELSVYHVATGIVNPLRISEIFDYIYDYFSANPLTHDLKSIKKMKFFNDFNEFSKYTRDEISKRDGLTNTVAINGKTLQNLQKKYKAKVAYAEELCKTYRMASFDKARFHTGNKLKLLEEMSKEEKLNFEIDATTRKYVLNATRVSS